MSWILASSDVDDAIMQSLDCVCAFSPSGAAGFCIHRHRSPLYQTARGASVNKDEMVVWSQRALIAWLEWTLDCVILDSCIVCMFDRTVHRVCLVLIVVLV